VVRHVREGSGVSGKYTRWYVVRNRDSEDTTSFDREAAEEETFSKPAWAEIPKAQRGTSMLKKYLAKLLSKRIRDSFPDMQDTVADLLREEKERRNKLGRPRSDESQRRPFLANIVKDFEDLATKALKAPGELPSNDVKLRGMTTAQTEQFAKALSERGLFYNFVTIGDPIEISGDTGDVVAQSEEDSYVSSCSNCLKSP
jgi:hypothetical protein